MEKYLNAKISRAKTLVMILAQQPQNVSKSSKVILRWQVKLLPDRRGKSEKRAIAVVGSCESARDGANHPKTLRRSKIDDYHAETRGGLDLSYPPPNNCSATNYMYVMKNTTINI